MPEFQMQDPLSAGATAAGSYLQSRQAIKDAAIADAEAKAAAAQTQTNLDRTYGLDVDKANETNRHNTKTEGIQQENADSTKQSKDAAATAAKALITLRGVQAQVEKGKLGVQQAQQHLIEVNTRLAGVRIDLLPKELQARITEARNRLQEAIRHNGVTESQGQQRLTLEAQKHDKNGKPIPYGQRGHDAAGKAALIFKAALNQGLVQQIPGNQLTGQGASIKWANTPAAKKLEQKYNNALQQGINYEGAAAEGETPGETESPPAASPPAASGNDISQL